MKPKRHHFEPYLPPPSPACASEIKVFIRGGVPGLQRLKEVLPTIFKHYGVRHKRQQAEILIGCKLMPKVGNKTSLTFVFEPNDKSDCT
jgi:hypothetical protein